MTILTGVLSAIGLLSKKEHETRYADLEKIADVNDELADQREMVSLLTDANVNLLSQLTTERERFKLAATDLAKQADEIGRLKAEHAEAVRWATTNENDATLWRNARDKRAKNRGGGK